MKVTSFGISFETQVLEFTNGQDMYNYIMRVTVNKFESAKCMSEIPNTFYDSILPIKYIAEY